MPILRREPDLFPDDFLGRPEVGSETERVWWAVHTLPRREKALVRRLRVLDVWHYLPQREHRFRSPKGRNRVSYVPLFPGYLFIYGSDSQRQQAVDTGCLARILHVLDGAKLTADLRQIKLLTDSGLPLTPEATLEPGVAVRVTSGPFHGFEGRLLKRHSGDQLLVLVNYLQQGISISLGNWEVERIISSDA